MVTTGPGPVVAETARIERRLADVESFADAIVAASASSQFHRRPFVEFIALGIPVRLPARLPSVPEVFTGTGVRILHAPSDPDSKGSNQIRAAVRALSDRGLALDYVELSGRPNAEILAALRDCDFVVDEVYSDTPMGVLAAEAALFGKPAVVGGYFSSLAEETLPAGAIPPTLFCEPEEVGAAIEHLVIDGESRVELGRRAREFVESRWKPRQVAERYVQIIDGLTPTGFITDPRSVAYLEGWGMPRATVPEGVRQIVASDGVGALRLTARPDLEALLQAFIDEPIGGLDRARGLMGEA